MKVLIRIGIVAFGVASLVAFSVSLFLVRRLYVHGSEPKGPPLRHHFALYLPDDRDSFFSAVVRGAETAAAEAGAAVTIHSIDPVRKDLEMAPYTGVDGVVCCPYLDDDAARRLLGRLTAEHIPVVLINHNVPADQPWPYIGVNNFDVGRRMGAIAKSAGPSGVRPAVVYSDKAPGLYADRELVEMGLVSALGGRLAAPVVGLKTDRNPMDAEEMVYRLFRESSAINTIFFTDSSDTVAAAQAIIDLNLVGRVRIVGFGNEKLILEYIRKGVIAGSVVVDPERIGYEAVRSLADLAEKGYTPTTIDTGVSVVAGSGL